MSAFDGNESWLIQRRTGTLEDPYVEITQQITIINGRGQFSEVPSKFDGVIIKSVDNTVTYSSKDNGVPTTTCFVIDYNFGTITADSSFNNISINVTYFGTGRFFLSVQRVYTRQDNGSVTETLKDIVEDGRTAIDAYGGILDAINSALTTKDSLVASIALGNLKNLQYKRIMGVTY